MRNAIVVTALMILLPYVSGAIANCPATQKPGRLTRPPAIICPPSKPLVDQVKSLQGSILGLTSAASKLATAAENETKGQSKSASSQPLSKELFDNTGWLTLMAVVIALFAYMAGLNWSLHDKIVQVIQGRGREGLNTNDIERLKRQINKFRKAIWLISLGLFMLGASLVSIIILLFGPHLYPPQFSAAYIAIVSFVLAVVALFYFHSKEWRNVIRDAFQFRGEK
jgi:hypothetical protein